MARRKSDAAARARRAVADIPEQLAALRSLTVAQLRERYREVFGEPTRSRNKDWLRKKVAWRIQELAEGGLSDRALARIDKLADGAPTRRRSSGNGASSGAAAAAIFKNCLRFIMRFLLNKGRPRPLATRPVSFLQG